MDFSIRPATRSDLPALGRLGAALMRLHYEFDPKRFMAPPDRPEEGYAWFLGTQLDADDAVILVAHRDDAILGYVYAAIEPASWCSGPRRPTWPRSACLPNWVSARR